VHPAIGVLGSGGYYAFLQGYDNEATFSDDTQVLERMIGLKEKQERSPGQAKEVVRCCDPTKTPRLKPTLKTYEVRVELKHPSATHSGCTLTVSAANQKEAIKLARAEVRSQLLYDRHDGPLIYSAKRMGNNTTLPTGKKS